MEVLPIACDECPVTEITVGPSCRGCLPRGASMPGPKDAITIVNHRACIDHGKVHLLRPMWYPPVSTAPVSRPRGPVRRAARPERPPCGPDRKASIDVSQCIACGNCVYQCPFGAIQDKSFITDAIHIDHGC
ncbi:MAG: 4Fe-4S binding protein [Lawsonibacter sp.]